MEDERLVIHIGPISSKGGMSGVMKLLIANPPVNYKVGHLDTYIDSSTLIKILNLFRIRRKLIMDIKSLKPNVFHFHVTHNFSWWRNLFLIRIALKFKIPCIINIHSGKFDIFCKKFNSIPGRIFRRLSKNKLIQFVVLEDRWIESLQIYANNLVCIRNPIDLKELSDRNEIEREDISLLLIARNDKIKGHDFAVEVLRLINEGGFEARLEMTGVKKNFNIPHDLNVTTHEWIHDFEEVRRKIKNSDFALSPSEYEGSSMSVLEAMSLGTIPIVSKVSSETVSVKELVVDNMNPEDWAKAIIKIVSKGQQRDLREKIKKTIKRHEVNHISNQWKDQYNMIIESN